MDKTKIVGVTFDGRQEIISNINEMTDILIPIREPDNPHDKNAINVYVKKHNGEMKSIGYINRHLAAKLSPEIDEGKDMNIFDFFVTGGTTEKGTIHGVLISYILDPSLSKKKEV